MGAGCFLVGALSRIWVNLGGCRDIYVGVCGIATSDMKGRCEGSYSSEDFRQDHSQGVPPPDHPSGPEVSPNCRKCRTANRPVSGIF